MKYTHTHINNIFICISFGRLSFDWEWIKIHTQTLERAGVGLDVYYCVLSITSGRRPFARPFVESCNPAEGYNCDDTDDTVAERRFAWRQDACHAIFDRLTFGTSVMYYIVRIFVPRSFSLVRLGAAFDLCHDIWRPLQVENLTKNSWLQPLSVSEI